MTIINRDIDLDREILGVRVEEQVMDGLYECGSEPITMYRVCVDYKISEIECAFSEEGEAEVEAERLRTYLGLQHGSIQVS